MKVYTMRDNKANEYGPLLLMQNDEVLIRQLRDNFPQTSMPRRYPTDFEIYCVGWFDPARGVLTAQVPGEFVCNLAQVFGEPSQVEMEV